MRLIILFLWISLNVYSQTFNLNNTLGFNYSDNEIKTYSGSFISSNSYEKKWFSINNSLNENITYSNKITQHEFANKLSLGLSHKHHSAFINFQTNYSLTRELNVNNLFGVGYGRRDSINSFQIRYSYAILYEKINNKGITYLRHSVRLKLSQVINKFSWSTEYYYQPYVMDINNMTLYGTTTISYKVKNTALSLIDVFNYNSVSNVRVIHSLSIGLSYVFNTKTK